MKILMISVVFAVTGAGWAALPAGPGWHTIPNTKLATVCACTKGGFNQVCGVQGWYDCLGVFSWSGGVFDSKRNRLLVWGGGHNAYYGNEFYSFNLDDQTLTRLNDPGLPIASGCQEAIAGGTQANSRHTYDGIEYMPSIDRMFVFSGSLACGPGNFGSWTWIFDFATMKWQKMNPTGPLPQAAPGIMTAYDSASGLLYLHDRKYFFSYDYAADKYTQLSTQYLALGYHMSATIDSKRRKFVMVGWDAAAGAGRVYAYDLPGTATKTIQTLATTGGSAIVGEANGAVEYDPVRDRVVSWNGGNTLYSLNLDTRQWSGTTYTGAPAAPSDPQGWACTFGRLRYVPKYDVFALVNEYNQDALIFRYPSASVENAPAAPPSRPVNGVVYDVRGRRVGRMINGAWEARPARSGIYIVRIKGPSKKVLVCM